MNALSRQLRHLQRGYRLAALLLVLPIFLSLSACSGGEAEQTPAEASAEDARAAIPVEVVVVDRGVFEDVLEMTGTIEAPEDVTLSAESAGTLTLLAPLGSVVRRGQVVAQTNPSLAQAAVSQAEAAVAAAEAQAELAEDQFRRQEPLYRDSIISALEFESVRSQRASTRAQVAQAEAQLAQARQQLANTRLVAPFTGIVEERLVERGEQVNPGAPVLRLVSTDRVKVRAGVPERYAGDIEQGTPVTVTPQAYGIPPRRGTVTFVGRTIDPQSRTFPIEVELDNATGQLKPEMVVKVAVRRAVLEDAIAIPLSAIVRDERGPSVFIAETPPRAGEGAAAGPVARYRPVLLGTTTGGLVVVEDGLAEGDEVLIQGQTVVADGDAVRIVERHASLPVTTAALVD